MKYFKFLLAFSIIVSSTLFISGCKNGDQRPIPATNFTFKGDNNFAPCKVVFTNTSTDAVSYAWDFGDEQTSTIQSPNHVYETGGTFEVTMKASDSYGAQNVFNNKVTIKNVPTKLKINSMVLNELPRITLCSDGWEFIILPHLFFTFKGVQEINYSTTEVYKNVIDCNLPLTFSAGFPFTIRELDFQYVIDLWNSDNLISKGRIGGHSFKVRDFMPTNGDPYPTTINFISAGSQLKFTLNVEFVQ